MDIWCCCSPIRTKVVFVLVDFRSGLVGIKLLSSVGGPAQFSKSVILEPLFRKGNRVDTVISALRAHTGILGISLSFESPVIFVGNIIGARVPAFAVIDCVHFCSTGWFIILFGGISSPGWAFVSRFSWSMTPSYSFLSFLHERVCNFRVKIVHGSHHGRVNGCSELF